MSRKWPRVRGKSETRIPKSEGRPKSEIRMRDSAKVRIWRCAREKGAKRAAIVSRGIAQHLRQAHLLPTYSASFVVRVFLPMVPAASTPGFGFRVSDFLRISDFGFRICSCGIA